MIRALIVEDEVRGLINLKRMLGQHCPQVSVVAEAGTLEDAADLLSDQRPGIDLAFLDINLPDGQVFDLLDRIAPLDFSIIFVTAFDQFAIKAFEYASIGYVLKPIDPEALVAAVSRVRPQEAATTQQRVEQLQRNVQNQNFDRITISAVDGISFVNIDDLLRIEADDNYSHLFTTDGQRHTVSKTIKHYEQLLQGKNFFRVHKSHIVNLDHMSRFVKGDGGYLVMRDDKQIAVSRRRRPHLMERIRSMGARFEQ